MPTSELSQPGVEASSIPSPIADTQRRRHHHRPATSSLSLSIRRVQVELTPETHASADNVATPMSNSVVVRLHTIEVTLSEGSATVVQDSSGNVVITAASPVAANIAPPREIETQAENPHSGYSSTVTTNSQLDGIVLGSPPRLRRTRRMSLALQSEVSSISTSSSPRFAVSPLDAPPPYSDTTWRSAVEEEVVLEEIMEFF